MTGETPFLLCFSVILMAKLAGWSSATNLLIRNVQQVTVSDRFEDTVLDFV